MKIYHKTLLIICCLISYSCNSGTAYAGTDSPNSVMFFVSNNTGNISISTAYSRVMGIDQSSLQSGVIQTMQNNNIQQGKFENILGMYKGFADNTEDFITSPYQRLSEQKIEALAKELAVVFNQQSVAVFIPDNSGVVGDITVTFNTRHTFNEAEQILTSKLPAKYNKAFSMHLDPTYTGINAGIVTQIEWLGSTLDIQAIKNAFPNDNITTSYGKAVLIYQDGRIENL